MKRRISAILVCLLLVTFAFTACGPGAEPEPTDTTVHVSSVTLSETTLSLQVETESTLTATVLPADAADKSITWSSSNTAIATVDQNGKITAVAVGSAVITVTATDGNKKKSCTVTVTPIPVPVTGISLMETSRDMAVGNTRGLTTVFAPLGATNKTVAWTSSDTAVATVAADTGVITALAAGNTTITVTTEDGNKTATATIVVKETITDAVAISTPADFAALNGIFNAQKSFDTDGAEGTIKGSFYLTNDIDFGGAVIKPIGGNEWGLTGAGNPTGKRLYAFDGIFDGRGYTLKNFETATGGPLVTANGAMQSNEPTVYGATLFAGTSPNAVIRNLSGINGLVYPSGARRAGVLVGTHRGLIENCFIQGETNSAGANNYEIGGAIAGEIGGSAIIRNVVVDVKGNGNIYPLGRVVSSTVTITNCFFTTDDLEREDKNTVWCFGSTNADRIIDCVRFAKADIATVNFSTLPAESWELTAGQLPKVIYTAVP